MNKIELIVEPAKTEDPIKKTAAKKPVALRYFDVRIECMIPATLSYRVLAEDAHKAVELIRGKTPNSVNHKIIGRKEKILRVYDSGCSMIKLMLNVWNGKIK